MSCSKEDFCAWQSYKQLIQKFKEATDDEQKAKIKNDLHRLCQLCGRIPLPEIMRILEGVELPETEASYIKNSLNLIERCADKQDFKTINTLVTDINRISGCDCQHCEPEEIDFAMAMRRGFSSIQGNVSPMAAPNLEEDAREAQYPEICIDSCKYVTCPYRRQENFNLPCKQRWKPLRRSLNPDNMEE